MNKIVLTLSFIVATRFFGLFIILPVFGLYSGDLAGASAMLSGVAIGIYALMQMVFQTPFGYLSDKIGRKKALLLGLFIFFVGSLICAFATDIWVMIAGRTLQGVGAVGAVGIAMISDFTSEEERGKAMTVMGMMIGLSFAMSMVLSPVLARNFGLSSLFYISAGLTLICVIMLLKFVPKEIKISSFSKKLSFFEIVKHRDLSLMNLTNFLQKMFMVMAFFITPIILKHKFGLESFIGVYSLAMIFGLVSMGFAGFMGEKKGLGKEILLLGVLFFIASYFVFGFSGSAFLFSVGVVLFFIGFNIHEPIMQSITSKFAKADQKGAVLGVFNSAGYFGSFVGGVFAGAMVENSDIKTLSLVVVVAGVIWFLLLLGLTNPKIFKNLYLEKAVDFAKISEISGIVDGYQKGDKFIIKYNSNLIDEIKIKEILAQKSERKTQNG